MSWICIRCQGTGEEGKAICPHCGLIVPGDAIALEDEPDPSIQATLSVPGIKIDHTEIRWDRRGWIVGACLGFLVQLLVLVCISRPSFGLTEFLGVLVCAGPLASFLGGALGMFAGTLVGVWLRAVRAPPEADERILEVAMDQHEEIEKRWSSGAESNELPSAAENSTDITRPHGDGQDRVTPSQEAEP